MSSRTKQFGAVMCLVAMAFFAGWPFWSWVNARPVSRQVRERTEALVKSKPELQTAWEIAVQDDVLTRPEAQVLVEAAGEKLEAE